MNSRKQVMGFAGSATTREQMYSPNNPDKRFHHTITIETGYNGNSHYFLRVMFQFESSRNTAYTSLSQICNDIGTNTPLVASGCYQDQTTSSQVEIKAVKISVGPTNLYMLHIVNDVYQVPNFEWEGYTNGKVDFNPTLVDNFYEI